MPRVRVFASDRHQGTIRNGTNIDAFGIVFVSIDGLPEVFRTDPTWQCQIELLRYVPLRRKYDRDQGRYVKMPKGYYHPSEPGSGSGGTRGGSINGTSVPRPTQWPVTSFNVGGGVSLYTGVVFAPYFDRRKVTDAYGGSIETLVYHIGASGKRMQPSGVLSYGPNPFRGVFAFRFAIFDTASQRWIAGPISDPVYIRPGRWATRPFDSPAFGYPDMREVSVVDAANLTLVAGIGGYPVQKS